MILDTIAQASRNRVLNAKKKLPLEQLKAIIYDGEGVRSFHNRTAFAFERALKKYNRTPEENRVDCNRVEDIAFICEIKKASPSKGVLAEDFPYLTIAKEYEQAGADAISVLTEPEFFHGADQFLTEISDLVRIPVLRKDFIVDEYQIYEAKMIGADAILLLCSLLDIDTLKRFLRLSNELGLSALVEAHTKEEVSCAIAAGARVIGVNNRNLQNFEVDLSNSIKLRGCVPKDIIYVAESGIKTSDDIAALKTVGVDAVLIGEILMRSSNKREQLFYLKGK